MKLLFYTTAGCSPRKKMQYILNDLVPTKYLTISTTTSQLSKLLCRIGKRSDIVILFPATRIDLIQLLKIKNLLLDLRIILILPDNDQEMISKGFLLHPRFLRHPDRNFSDVRAVLKKMLTAVNVRNKKPVITSGLTEN